MTKSNCYLNLGLILILGVIFAYVSNLLFSVPDYVKSSFWNFIGVLTGSILPALVILLLQLTEDEHCQHSKKKLFAVILDIHNLQYQIIYGKMKLKVVFILLFSIAVGSTLSGQNRNKKITITGYVVDANKYPVANATIMIDNKKTNSVTDHNGYYKVKAKPSAQKIEIITFILATGDVVLEPIICEEPINGITRINFTLATSIPRGIHNMISAEFGEDIDIGYGTVKRRNLSNSVSRIDGKNKKYTSYSNIYDMFRGVPGVRVLENNKIQIRGVNSIYLSTEPLFVVNGMAVNSIDYISPQWVKSIEVLKDASSSIYGSRGASGVILINLHTTY